MQSVLAIAAHPDDIEFLMAGTLLLLRKAGWEVHYFNVADGCCGSLTEPPEVIAAQRRSEAQQAAALLGGTHYESICHDLAIFYDQPTLARVAAVVRQARPSVVLTHAPLDYMEDHMITCRLATTAVFARAMPNFPTDPPATPYGQPVALYHAQPYGHRDPLGKLVEPSLFIDISEQIEAKQRLLACHVSQKTWLDASQGLESYLNTQRELDAECGRMSGLFAYAEGWRRHNALGFCGERDDPLREALMGKILPA